MFSADKILNCFNLKKGDIISVTGGGGKTSLILLLSEILSKYGKVLITTTTKIYTPSIDQYENLYFSNLAERLVGKNKNIDILGAELDESREKLIGVPDEVISKIRDKYDYIIIEADGSARKSIKAWTEKDPVISKFTTKIIGVTNLAVLGKKIHEVVHREQLFSSEYKTDSHETVTLELMTEYLKKGDFFKIKDENIKTKNIEKYFFVNGIEGIERFNSGLFLGNNLSDELQSKNIKMIMGSIYEKEFYPYKRIGAIGLLSGFSKRMGRDKLLIEYKGKPLMEHLLDRLDEINFYKKIVVSTEERLNIFQERVLKGYIKIKNTDPSLGQSQSIKLGISAMDDNLDGFMFFTGDQPFLRKETVLKLIMEFLKESQVVLPYYGERSFSPVIFPVAYKDRLVMLNGDKGGKSILDSQDKVTKVPFKEGRDFIDIDCEEDLQYLK